MVVANEVKPTDAVDAAIDRLASGNSAEAEASKAEQRSRFAAELAQEAEKRGVDSKTGEQSAVEQADAPPNVWTLDRMMKNEPVTADLYGDGEFLFTFRPTLGLPYCQERFHAAEAMDMRKPWAYYKLQKAYVDIVLFCLVSWPLRETVQDEDGVDVLDAEGEVLTVPLTISRDNVARLNLDLLTKFLNAMTATIRGEASGQD